MNDELDTLHRAADRLVPDVDRLVAEGTTRGRALRRRRRVGASLAAAGAVAVLAVGVAVVPSLADGDGRAAEDPGLADDPSGAPDTSPIPPQEVKPEEPVQSPPAGSPDPSVRARDLPGLVAGLFPGEISDAPEDTGQIMNGGESFQIAHFLWNGMLVSVGGAGSGGGTPMARCQDSAGDGATCVEQPDGSALLTWEQTGPVVDGAVTGRGVQLYVKGWEIFAISYNAGDGKDSPLLAEEPPFTHAQLETIVKDPSWFD